MYAPTRTVAPAATPISVAEAKLQLRVDHSDDDALIGGLIDSATVYLDGWTGILGRCLVTQTWSQTYDDFCREMRLPLPAATVTSIISTNAAGVAQSPISDTNYQLLHNALGSFVRFKDAYSFAGDLAEAGAVAITFTAGYGVAAAVPAPIKQAMMLLIANWYQNREAVIVGGYDELPFGVKALLSPYRRIGV